MSLYPHNGDVMPEVQLLGYGAYRADIEIWLHPVLHPTVMK